MYLQATSDAEPVLTIMQVLGPYLLAVISALVTFLLTRRGYAANVQVAEVTTEKTQIDALAKMREMAAQGVRDYEEFAEDMRRLSNNVTQVEKERDQALHDNEKLKQAAEFCTCKYRPGNGR